MEDNDMRLSCKGCFVISHLWRWELLQTGDCQVGIDTLIANILVLFFSSPNLSGRRLDVYHTVAHGVALVRI